jgi:hypothetical protein
MHEATVTANVDMSVRSSQRREGGTQEVRDDERVPLVGERSGWPHLSLRHRERDREEAGGFLLWRPAGLLLLAACGWADLGCGPSGRGEGEKRLRARAALAAGPERSKGKKKQNESSFLFLKRDFRKNFCTKIELIF